MRRRWSRPAKPSEEIEHYRISSTAFYKRLCDGQPTSSRLALANQGVYAAQPLVPPLGVMLPSFSKPI